MMESFETQFLKNTFFLVAVFDNLNYPKFVFDPVWVNLCM